MSYELLHYFAFFSYAFPSACHGLGRWVPEGKREQGSVEGFAGADEVNVF